jgi:hypothetical protein
MRPLPVIATIRDAYQFTFTHLGAIMGLIWLPMVIVTVASFFVEQRLTAEMIGAQATNDYAALGPALLGSVLFLLAAILLNAMMYVSVTQLALGQRQGGVMVHFSLGAPEWRMFRALLGLVLFLAVPIFVIELTVMAPGLTSPMQQALATIIAAVVLWGLLFIAVRFAFLLAPVVVVEDKPALARSWLLSAGNFWRMFAVMLGAAGPAVLVTLLVQAVLGNFTGPHEGGFLELLQQPGDLPLDAGLKFLVAPFVLGLGVSASAFSYRALTRTDLSV